MGLFEPERTNSAPHPRKEPRFPEPLSRLRAVWTIWSGRCTSTGTGSGR